MIPGKRRSDAADLLGGLAALGSLLCVLFIMWGTAVGFVAATWVLFVHFVRMMGGA